MPPGVGEIGELVYQGRFWFVDLVFYLIFSGWQAVSGNSLLDKLAESVDNNGTGNF